PLLLVLLMSVSDVEVAGLPVQGVTARWYWEVLADRDVRAAFGYSCLVAVASTAVSLVMGVWVALALDGVRSAFLRGALLVGACLPIVTPGIVSAISLRMFVRVLGLDPGYVAIILGHAVHATPFVVIMLAARLRMVPPHLVAAARTLGASQARAFCSVTLPWLLPTIAGAAVLALLESFDDFLRSFFLGGYEPTLPVLFYGRLFSGLSPEINAIAATVLVLTIALGLAGERLSRYVRRI
ncbi:MAG TPA: ABC transporter permease, partial [Acetobacteraceae bacterium]|nr:ABC transporter permease [Acetobacteraceae bacterium]